MAVVALDQGKSSKAATARYTDELRWIRAYQTYSGVSGSAVQFTSPEKSKVFVRVKKTKVLAAYGQIVEELFGLNNFPFLFLLLSASFLSFTKEDSSSSM